eukprot:2681525-Rhodomonas_salina.1
MVPPPASVVILLVLAQYRVSSPVPPPAPVVILLVLAQYRVSTLHHSTPYSSEPLPPFESC